MVRSGERTRYEPGADSNSARKSSGGTELRERAIIPRWRSHHEKPQLHGMQVLARARDAIRYGTQINRCPSGPAHARQPIASTDLMIACQAVVVRCSSD